MGKSGKLSPEAGTKIKNESGSEREKRRRGKRSEQSGRDAPQGVAQRVAAGAAQPRFLKPRTRLHRTAPKAAKPRCPEPRTGDLRTALPLVRHGVGKDVASTSGSQWMNASCEGNKGDSSQHDLAWLQ